MTCLEHFQRVVPAVLALSLVSTPLNGLENASDAALPIVLKSDGIVDNSDAGNTLPDRRSPRAIVRERASRSGWEGAQWRCLDAIIYRESRWNPRAANKHSSARGLFQMLKQDPALSVEEQTKRGLRYVRSRYGSPCEALAWHNAHGWY